MPTNWTTPRTWVAYEPVTKNLLNTYVRNQFLSVSFLSTRFVTTDTSLASVTMNLPTSSEATHCEIHVHARTEGAANLLNAQVGSTGTEYHWQLNRFGNAGAVGAGAANSSAWAVGNLPGSAGSTGDMSYTKILLPDHCNTRTLKTFTALNAAFLSSASTSGFVNQFSGLFFSTGSLSAITLFSTAGNFSAGCEFSVYGMP